VDRKRILNGVASAGEYLGRIICISFRRIYSF